MTIDFPSSPSDGQTYLVGVVSWTWANGHWISSCLSAAGGSPAPAPAPFITITGSAALPAGYTGFVRAENATAAPMSIFLPPTPTEGQAIEIKDTVGNAGTYPITVDGAGQMIEGAATMVIGIDYGWVDLIYTGSIWVQT